MCDECSRCSRPGWLAGELRLAATNELTCSDCHDEETPWNELLTVDEAAEMHIATLNGRAHAARDRRAAL